MDPWGQESAGRERSRAMAEVRAALAGAGVDVSGMDDDQVERVALAAARALAEASLRLPDLAEQTLRELGRIAASN